MALAISQGEPLGVRSLLIIVAIFFPTTAFAHSAPAATNRWSGKAERADRLQARWNGPRHKAWAVTA